MNSFNVTIGQDKKQVFINVYYNNIRYRFWNGKAIEIKLRCIDNPTLQNLDLLSNQIVELMKFLSKTSTD